MDNLDYFHKLNLNSTLIEHLESKIKSANEADWDNFLDMSILLLTRDDFITEPKLLKLIDDFNCNEKLGIYRYVPNFCYQWHIDAIRNTAINLQLQGEDSLCVFGKLVEPRKFGGVVKLKYDHGSYYIINTSKFHTVFNFDNPRYLLSIGFNKPTTFNDVKQYAIENNL